MSSASAPAADIVNAPHHASRNYGRLIEQTWIWSVVGYSLVRFLVAWGAFSEHGANVWIFGLIDVGTAWPYGKAVATVCKRSAAGEWSRLPVPLGAAVVMFFAPYAYLWFAAGEMPAGVRVGLAICVSVLFLAATAGVFAKSRKLRREAREVVIDLRDGADAVVHVAEFTGRESNVVDLRDEIPAGDLLIDLTGDDVTVGRSSAVG